MCPNAYGNSLQFSINTTNAREQRAESRERERDGGIGDVECDLSIVADICFEFRYHPSGYII